MIAHLGIVLALAATVIYNLGFMLEKRALAHAPPIDVQRPWRLVRILFSAPGWLAGFVLICGGLVMQTLVLSLEPLTVAQPLQASGVVVTIGLSRLMLKERPGRTELACIGIIAAAVVLLSLSSGQGTAAGNHASAAGVALAVAAAVLAALVIFGAVWRAGRRRHRFPVSGLSYGLCAGLMYGAAGLALKALSAAVFTSPARLRPVHGSLLTAAVSSPYLYVMLGCVAAGMGLFQTALQRSPASIVIPVSALISTGYLIVIGSWLFHERLPAGPVPLVMRVVGAAATAVVPVILAAASERSAARARPGARPGPRSGQRPAGRHSSRPATSQEPAVFSVPGPLPATERPSP